MAITFENDSVWQVAAIGRFNDESEVRNVYQLAVIDGGPVDQATGLADIEDWLLVILNILKTVQVALQVWRGFSVADLNGDDATGEVAFSGGDIVGDISASDALPSQVAMLSFMNTGTAGVQLRKYWNGLGEVGNDTDGLLTTGMATAVSGIGTHLLQPYIGNDVNLLYGHWQPGDFASGKIPQTFVTEINPSTQRRRRVGRGI